MAATTSLPPGFGGLAMMRPHENAPTRLRRSWGKRVTWAAANHLCEVRMFLAEDAPFRAGLPQGQDELQGKIPRFLQKGDDLPPGFGGGVVSCLKNDPELVTAAVSAAIPWTSPQKIELDPSWHVEAGEGSNEVQVQRQRESKTLEAVYPRSSAIPSSPLEAPVEPRASPDAKPVFVIPVSAPDDDSDGEESSRNNAVNGSACEQSYSGGAAGVAATSTATATAAGAAAAAAALSQAAVASAIDPSLLLQLLANPSLVETLSGVRNNSLVNGKVQLVAGVKNLTSNSTVSTTTTTTKNVSSMGFTDASYSSLSHLVASPLPSSSASASTSGPGPAAAAAASTSETSASWAGPFQAQAQASVSSRDDGPGIYGGYKNGSQMMRHPQQQQQQFMFPNAQSQQHQQQQQQQQSSNNLTRQNELYYKELIMQHGATNGGGGHKGYVGNGYIPGMESTAAAATATSAAGHQVGHAGAGAGAAGFRRSNRTCAYFNTPKGCRNGVKCPFVHDSKRAGSELALHQHQQQAKRMRG